MSGILLLVDGLEKSKYFREEMFLDTDLLFLHKTLFQLFQSESQKKISYSIFSERYCQSTLVQNLDYSEE